MGTVIWLCTGEGGTVVGVGMEWVESTRESWKWP